MRLISEYTVYFQEHVDYSEERVNAFHCDLTEDSLESHLSKCSVDIATLVFVLSAIHPVKMLAVLLNIMQVSYFADVHSLHKPLPIFFGMHMSHFY